LDVPHDGVVEGDFSESENASGVFLPPVSAWYRRHLALPPSFAGATMWLELDGVMQSSSVFLNGAFLGNHSSGFTTQRYFLSPSVLRLGQDNVLAVWHCSAPLDGWWYNGGGIVRGVSLTVVSTPGPFLSPWGIYAPSVPTGAITFSAAGAPSADAELLPSIDVGSLAPGAAEFVLSLLVVAADGSTLASSSGSGSAAGSGSRTTWSPTAPLALPQAALWHLVAPPLTPALYTLVVRLSVGGVEVDAENVTFGVRSAVFNNATGFWLNGVRTKIQGFSNHQDSAAVGVAVPAHMQWNRVALLKACGANAWRTAHNPPAPALLAAADELGLLVMDEDHRNGQDAETPLMVLTATTPA
jgi:beta-galactosidase